MGCAWETLPSWLFVCQLDVVQCYSTVTLLRVPPQLLAPWPMPSFLLDKSSRDSPRPMQFGLSGAPGGRGGGAGGGRKDTGSPAPRLLQSEGTTCCCSCTFTATRHWSVGIRPGSKAKLPFSFVGALTTQAKLAVVGLRQPCLSR